ncbi:unnamed protein product [Oikopleura dioica]|uniref:Uncharacterized protein n=1 Tax=Oikopleura dioica TaxID=34765 RepID=E4Y2Y1_OIKDI|nr:unnamed protein product [Oikopleura dioica]
MKEYFQIDFPTSDEFSAISAWDKSVPSEYESVENLYSEEKCDCGGGFQYSEKSTVDFNQTTIRRNNDFKSYMKNHIFDYVKSPLHVNGANTPIEFVSAGYEIAPDEIFSPHVVIKLPESTIVELILETTVGDFLIDGEPIDLKKDRKISVQKANKFLEKIQYKSRFYDARAIKDIVKISVIEEIVDEKRIFHTLSNFQKAYFSCQYFCSTKLRFDKLSNLFSSYNQAACASADDLQNRRQYKRPRDNSDKNAFPISLFVSFSRFRAGKISRNDYYRRR